MCCPEGAAQAGAAPSIRRVCELGAMHRVYGARRGPPRGSGAARERSFLSRCERQSQFGAVREGTLDALRAPRTRSDRSREVPPRLLRSKTPGRNATRGVSPLVAAQQTTLTLDVSPCSGLGRVRRRGARRREHGALLWAIRRKLPPQPCARTPARMDLVLLLRFFGSGQGAIR